MVRKFKVKPIIAFKEFVEKLRKQGWVSGIGAIRCAGLKLVDRANLEFTLILYEYPEQLHEDLYVLHKNVETLNKSSNRLVVLTIILAILTGFLLISGLF